MQLAELRPFAKKVDVLIKVLDKGETREVTSKLGGQSHRVTEVLVGDASGTILLTLWDEAIDKLTAGKCYKLSNGFTSLFKRTLRLNAGRYGIIEETPDEVSVNAQNNVSEQPFEERRP